jgi:hypothetical protein
LLSRFTTAASSACFFFSAEKVFLLASFCHLKKWFLYSALNAEFADSPFFLRAGASARRRLFAGLLLFFLECNFGGFSALS